MKASIQNLIQVFKALIFGWDELEFREKSEPKAVATFGLLGIQFQCRDLLLTQ